MKQNTSVIVHETFIGPSYIHIRMPFKHECARIVFATGDTGTQAHHFCIRLREFQEKV